MTVLQKKDFLIKTAYYIVVAVLLYILYRFLVFYFFPFVIGLILAYLLQKPAFRLSKKIKVKTGTIAAVMVALSFAAVVAIAASIIIIISANASSIIGVISGIIGQAAEIISSLIGRLPEPIKNLDYIKQNEFVSFITSSVSSTLASFAAGAVKSVPSLIFGIIITVIASCFIARDYERVREYIISLLTPKSLEICRASIRIVTTNIFKIIRGYGTLTVITFIILCIGFALMRIKNPILLAGVVGVIDLLPVLGTGTVLLPWCVILLLGENYLSAVYMLILYLICTAVRNMAEPKIVGRQIGIPPLVMLICIFIGLKLFGFLGMILSVISLLVVINLYKEGLIEL